MVVGDAVIVEGQIFCVVAVVVGVVGVHVVGTVVVAGGVVRTVGEVRKVVAGGCWEKDGRVLCRRLEEHGGGTWSDGLLWSPAAVEVLPLIVKSFLDRIKFGFVLPVNDMLLFSVYSLLLLFYSMLLLLHSFFLLFYSLFLLLHSLLLLPYLFVGVALFVVIVVAFFVVVALIVVIDVTSVVFYIFLFDFL